MIHALKTWKEYYKEQENGNKLFEIRKNDRPYKVGDKFLSKEYDNVKNEYTGRETTYCISYVLRNTEMFGLATGYVILQLKEIEH